MRGAVGSLRRSVWTCVFVAVFIVGGVVVFDRLGSGGVVRGRFFVPVKVGDGVVKSSLIVECDVEEVDESLNSFAKGPGKADEKRVRDIVGAINAGDVETVKAFSVEPQDGGFTSITIEDACGGQSPTSVGVKYSGGTPLACVLLNRSLAGAPGLGMIPMNRDFASLSGGWCLLVVLGRVL